MREFLLKSGGAALAVLVLVVGVAVAAAVLWGFFSVLVIVLGWEHAPLIPVLVFVGGLIFCVGEVGWEWADECIRFRKIEDGLNGGGND